MSRAVGAAVAVTAVTKLQAERIRAGLPGLRTRIELILPGVEVPAVLPAAIRARLGLAPSAPLVVHVAGLRAEKGFPEAFDTADAIHDAVPQAAYVLAGPVLDPALDRGATAWFATRPWAHRAGPLGHDDTLALIAEAACTLHTSRIEGFSNALAESMALGAPPVARDIDASREAIVQRRTGLLYSTDHEAAVAVASLIDGAVRSDLGDDLGRAARTAATRDLSVETEIRRYADVLRRAAGAAHATIPG